jgi:hypothetical protein
MPFDPRACKGGQIPLGRFMGLHREIILSGATDRS